MQSVPETIPATGMDVSFHVSDGWLRDRYRKQLENRPGFPNVEIQRINHFSTQAQLLKSAQPNNSKNQSYI